MSIVGSLLTSVSGMNAQSTRLGSVADNISNSSTTGYKRRETEFQTLLGTQATSQFASGGVIAGVRGLVQEQGSIQNSSNVTDLAVEGSGFFIVENSTGVKFLTRAGAFVPDANGNLVNSAGFFLLAQDLVNGTGAAGGLTIMTKVNVNQEQLITKPSTKAEFSANLPSTASVIAAADLPSANAATAKYTATNSLVAYDNLGAAVTLDLYFSNTAANTWEVAVFNHADAATGGSFPYANPALATQTLNFSATTGAMTGATPLSVAVPNGQTVDIDLSKTTQLAASFSVQNSDINGQAPSSVDHIEIDGKGTVTAAYKNGARKDLYRVLLGTVASPNRLTERDGNVYEANSNSGAVRVNEPDQSGTGVIHASALENSTVDLGTELTSMIQTQRAYTANTKVFQASSDLLDALNNLRV